MPKHNQFANKIKELEMEEIEYTEDFFEHAFGRKKKRDNTSVNTLRKGASEGKQRSLSHSFSDKDIDDEWLSDEENFDGQLAVDVIETENEIVITSTVAGVAAQDLDLHMNGDMITIKGLRRNRFEHLSDDDYIIRECFWGGFSRSIILPADIQQDGIRASLENGVLTITLPKSKRSRNAKIDVVEINADAGNGFLAG
jgi:HSP20 family protein